MARAGTELVDLHQLVQNRELDGEFDGVGEGLRAGLVDPLAAEDLADEGDVEADAEHVEVDEELPRVPRLERIAGREHLDRGLDVNDRDDGFLQREDDELNPFVDVVHGQPHARVGLVAAEGLDGGGHLEDEEVGDDHDEHSA